MLVALVIEVFRDQIVKIKQCLLKVAWYCHGQIQIEEFESIELQALQRQQTKAQH